MTSRPNVEILRGADSAETETARRFQFGQNWASFLSTINEATVEEAKNSLISAVGHGELKGLSFVDIGCGSGLFSLAARALGANVISFDYDRESVRCAERLKAQFFPDDNQWTTMQGSILDSSLVDKLGSFDFAYAWGVLHHTGSMWRAIDNASSLVRVGGTLILAIYNDQGHWSRIWLRIKRTYNFLPKPLRPAFVFLVMLPRELRSLSFSLMTFQPSRYLQSWTRYRQFRGMSKWHDLVDWVGGLPFEVAKPEQVIFFLRNRGFELRALTTCGGEIGCNEYILLRRSVNAFTTLDHQS